MKKTVYLSLGSNLGERAKNLEDAIAGLGRTSVQIVRASSVYETEPVDFLDQPWFLNCAVEAETELGALDLLRALVVTDVGQHQMWDLAERCRGVLQRVPAAVRRPRMESLSDKSRCAMEQEAVQRHGLRLQGIQLD